MGSGMSNQSQGGTVAGGPRFGYGAAAGIRTGAAAAGTAGGGGRSHHTTREKVFVNGLTSQCGNYEFKTYFQNFGEVVDAQVMTYYNTGNSCGFGFVIFANESTVETVVGLGRSNTRYETMKKNC